MAATRSIDTLVRAARLYYEEGLSQGEVARRMGLSGATVSRVLAAGSSRCGSTTRARRSGGSPTWSAGWWNGSA